MNSICRSIPFLSALILASVSGTPMAGGEPPKNVVFFGDSLTSGYGLDPDEAFPALVQEKIDGAGLDFNVINAGLTGETSAGGLRRIDWILRQPVDVFVLELGGNDGLRGLPVEETEENLQKIIDRVEEKYPDAAIILAGMEAPPNMGETFTSDFAAVFPRLAKRNDLELIPFLLADVGGVPELNFPDGVHPTADGHEIVARNVWEVLKPVLNDRSGRET